MIPVYSQEWNLKDKKIERLDEARMELNEALSVIFFQALTSPYYISPESIRREENLLERLERNPLIRGKFAVIDDFDRLVLTDIKSNVNKARVHFDHFFNPKIKNGTIGKTLRGMYDMPVYNFLLNKARGNGVTNSSVDRYYRSMNRLISSSLDSEIISSHEDFADFKMKVDEKVKETKEVWERFYIDMNLVNDNPNYSFVANNKFDFSGYWQNSNSLMWMDKSQFMCISREENGINKHYIHNKIPIIVGIHEMAHGIHDKMSSRMPRGLNPKEHEYLNFIHGVSTEGIALLSEDISLDWLRKSMDRYGIKKEDHQFLDDYVRAYTQLKTTQAAKTILDLAENERKKGKKR